MSPPNTRNRVAVLTICRLVFATFAQRTPHPYPFLPVCAMESSLLQHPDIPEAQRRAAETVRAHLVHHRGGAPFLSPADMILLVDWLDTAVPLAAILAAIERCAVSRRRNGARTRFTLRSAKRHLYKAPLVRVDLEPADGEHVFQPLVEVLDAHEDPSARALGHELLSLPLEGVETAVVLCARRLEARWSDLHDDAREQRMAIAVAELGDIANLVDEATLHALAEEVARHQLREEWPRLDTATFQVLVGE